MKKTILIIICIIFAGINAKSQTCLCTNIDFEAGVTPTTTGWALFTGAAINATGSFGPIVFSAVPVATRHEITTGGVDPYGAFPKVWPGGGGRSLKLGNDQNTQSERARFVVSVPPTTDVYSLIYRYAVVLEAPDGPNTILGGSHTQAQAPRFMMQATDLTSSTVVGCSSYTYVQGNMPGFLLSPVLAPPVFAGVAGANDVYYRGWQSAVVSLQGHNGNSVAVDFSTTDCAFALHSGYAYIDMDCNLFPTQITRCTPATLNPEPISAPNGYQTYSWYNTSDWATLLTSSQTFNCPIPTVTIPTTVTYAVVMSPFPGYGCPETLYVSVNLLPTPVCSSILPVTLCVGDTKPTLFTGAWTTGGTWSGYDATKVSVDAAGNITGLAAGTTSVTYTISNICGTATAICSVTVNPLPTLISFAEITGNHCEGDMLTFIVNTDAGTPPKEISYNYILGGVPSISYMVSADAFGHFSITLPATGPVTSFHLDGIHDPVTDCWRVVDEWIYVIVDPHPTVGTLWGPSTLCQGQVASYHVGGVSGIGSGSTGWTYTSTSGPSSVTFNVIGITSTTLTAGDPGTGVLTYNVTNACGTASVSASINILPQPTVYSMSYIGCNIPCPGTPLTFKFTGTPGATVYWKWEDPTTPGIYTTGLPVTLSTGGATGVGFATIPGGALGEGMVTIFITNIMGANGCPNPIGPVGSVTVEWPKANFGQIPRSGICAGDCINYIAVYGPPGGTVYYSATPGPAFTPPISLDPVTGIGTMPVLCPTVTTTYQITGVVGPCCTHMYAGPSFTITVWPNPVVGLTSNSPICEGNPLILTATCPTCNQPYSWAGPASGLPTTTPPAITSHYTVPSATPSNSGIYTVTGAITYPPGDVTCTANATTSVIVDAKPYVTIRCRGYLCQYSSSVITLTFTGSPNATITYVSNPTGYGGSVTLSGGGTATVIIPVTSPTSSYDFYVTGIVSATGACIITDTLAVCNIMYLLRPSCPVTYNSSTGLITIAGWGPGMSLTFTCFDGTSWIPFTYTGSASSFSPSILPSGTVFLELNSFYDGYCDWFYGGDVCDIYLPSPSPRPGHDGNGNSIIISQHVSIIPNPNAGTFTIKGYLQGLTHNEKVAIDVMDVLGKTIVTDDATVENGYINKRIVISEVLPGGTYIVKIKNEKTSSTLRFTIER